MNEGNKPKQTPSNALCGFCIGIAFLMLANIGDAGLVAGSTQKTYNLTVDDLYFPIVYQIENADLDNISVDQEYRLIFTISNSSTTANGLLTVTLPRNLIDAVCGNEDIPFLVHIGENEAISGNSRDNVVEETSATIESRTLAIRFPPSTNIITIGVFQQELQELLVGCSRLTLGYEPSSGQHDYKILYNDYDSMDVTGVSVLNANPTIAVTMGNVTIRDSLIKMDLPRGLIDSRDADRGTDKPFTIVYSTYYGKSGVANYWEIGTNDISRTLLVAMPAGYKEVKIIGTQVIPEFWDLPPSLIVGIIIAGIIVSTSTAFRYKRSFA